MAKALCCPNGTNTAPFNHLLWWFMNGYTLQVASTQPFRKTLHLMTWVRMAVACTFLFLPDEQGQGGGLGWSRCSTLFFGTQGFQVTDVGAF